MFSHLYFFSQNFSQFYPEKLIFDWIFTVISLFSTLARLGKKTNKKINSTPNITEKVGTVLVERAFYCQWTVPNFSLRTPSPIRLSEVMNT